MPSTSAPPRPRRIRPGHGVFLSGSWFMALQQRNKGPECVWSVQVKTLRLHFEKAPSGVEISSATPVKAALRAAGWPLTRARIHPPPVLRLPTCWSDSPSSLRREIKRAARVIDRMSPHKSRVMIILAEFESFSSWPRFLLFLRRDWFTLPSIPLHFLISCSDFLILWHSTLNYSLLHT